MSCAYRPKVIAGDASRLTLLGDWQPEMELGAVFTVCEVPRFEQLEEI
jgi:hypothetical protein